MTIEFNIKEISFFDILPMWEKHLWPNRTSAIESTSAIKYGSFPYEYDIDYMSSKFYGFGAYVNDRLVGVNSGHMTGDSFRSRGLFVMPEFRKHGIGNALLDVTLIKATVLKADYIWSMPRRRSLPSYEKTGFVKSSDWFQTETLDTNCFAFCNLQNSKINFDAFSHGQMVSKVWLCDKLEPHLNEDSSITILGGWHNLLGFMLHVRRPSYYRMIQNIDIDPMAIKVADKICNAWVLSGECENIVGDGNTARTHEIVINCSVEHFANNDWFHKLPKGTLVCIQSTDATSIEHPWFVTQPSPTMESFREKFPVSEVLYAGTNRIQYAHLGYNRFMLIGKI